jgi:hypothetical protein
MILAVGRRNLLNKIACCRNCYVGPQGVADLCKGQFWDTAQNLARRFQTQCNGRGASLSCPKASTSCHFDIPLIDGSGLLLLRLCFSLFRSLKQTEELRFDAARQLVKLHLEKASQHDVSSKGRSDALKSLQLKLELLPGLIGSAAGGNLQLYTLQLEGFECLAANQPQGSAICKSFKASSRRR